MKKIVLLLFIGLSVLGLTACGKGDDKTIDKLVVGFVPSRSAEEILEATKPLEGLLKAELEKSGFTINEVEINVGTDYTAVGTGLEAGSMHVGFIPAGTYVTHDEGAEVILTATRDGYNKDSDNAKDWNDGEATQKDTSKSVTYYRSLIIAGPSAKGKELAKIINDGGTLTWDDIKDAKWQHGSTTSGAGYVYPTKWLYDNFGGKKMTDLTSASKGTGYAAQLTALKNGTIDVTSIYTDARLDNLGIWEGSETSIWDDCQVIGVSDKIYNDTISVTKDDKVVSDELQKALQDAFLNIANTDEGKEVISIYNHKGYQIAKDSDYDSEREVIEILK